MKTIIAGSRDIMDKYVVSWAVHDSIFKVTEIVSGGARGVDRLGEDYAEERGIPLKICPANWTKFGRAAGYIRNEEMAKYADALIAVWDGESKGTGHMIDLAHKHNLEVYVYEL